jgi:hypothetical protein
VAFPRGNHLANTDERVTSLWGRGEWKRKADPTCIVCVAEKRRSGWREITKQDVEDDRTQSPLKSALPVNKTPGDSLQSDGVLPPASGPGPSGVAGKAECTLWRDKAKGLQLQERAEDAKKRAKSSKVDVASTHPTISPTFCSTLPRRPPSNPTNTAAGTPPPSSRVVQHPGSTTHVALHPESFFIYPRSSRLHPSGVRSAKRKGGQPVQNYDRFENTTGSGGTGRKLRSATLQPLQKKPGQPPRSTVLPTQQESIVPPKLPPMSVAIPANPGADAKAKAVPPSSTVKAPPTNLLMAPRKKPRHRFMPIRSRVGNFGTSTVQATWHPIQQGSLWRKLYATRVITTPRGAA